MSIRQIKLDFETVLNLLSLARRSDLDKAETGELAALAIAEAKVVDVISRQEEKRLHEEERKDRVGL